MASLNVLIVSENISMKMGGESSLPFYYAKLFSDRGAVVWLACHERVKDEVLGQFANFGSRVHFVEDTRLQRFLNKYSNWLPYRLRAIFIGQFIHFSTQWRIRKIARELASKGLIDVVLEPSPITPKGLSFMYGIGVPVVIGPMCGGMEFPPGFRHLDSWLTRQVVGAGRALSLLANRIVPGKLRADVLLVANKLTELALPPGVSGQVVRLFESGVDLALWTPSTLPRGVGSEVRFVFSGRFVDWKGIQFLLPAFESAVKRNDACRLELIGGGGPFEGDVRQLAARPELAGRVRIHGWLTRERAAEILREADVFVMPSLRECGGTAILEAMAMGKPVITTDWGGPADYVNSSCGILVPPTNPDAFISGLSDAMVNLASSAELRQDLGAGGRRRVTEEFLAWDAKADRVLAILGQAVKSRRKDFGIAEAR